MKIRTDSTVDEARIELIPLIDVVFCILTFFILASLQLTRQQAINVDLPKASTGETQMQKMLIVGIDTAGQTYIEQQPVNQDQLDRTLLRFRRWNPSGLIVLYAPKEARYNDVVRVLDRLRAIGGERVALATLPSSQEIQPPTNPLNPSVTPPANPSNIQPPFAPTTPNSGDALPPIVPPLPNPPNSLPSQDSPVLTPSIPPSDNANPFVPQIPPANNTLPSEDQGQRSF
ncbi:MULTISPECIES: ExbD/TolR family protein [Planktothrix]|uniref:Biopolymer transporter ExbD n=1 Tax=Planktothrix mougeotii LEGE 06226 TaxID=1828728 RepID=A0ABR9U835_9CYAN|nr:MULTISPECIES: biopolymer transporter ExbD [Planktothrix]MBD2481084.1 biopolymer transporter ExbD [Planktothrix sp. FACHB-1365]MBE9142610.1 biopolymer transporter ExbD [Planktothrix mougeotii LEGE 06226]